ncbi:hypothetical protein [Methylomonas lenta]|nr:hypothetical protein [Methylomonas lenta]
MKRNHTCQIAILMLLAGFLGVVSAAPGGGGRQGAGGVNQGGTWQTNPAPRGNPQQQQMQETNRQMKQEHNQQDGSWQMQEREREREQNQIQEQQMQR